MTGAAKAAGPARACVQGPVANDLEHLDQIAACGPDGPRPKLQTTLLVQKKIASSAVVTGEARAHFVGVVLKLLAQDEQNDDGLDDEDQDDAGMQEDLYEIVLRRRGGIAGGDLLVGRYEDAEAIAAWQASAKAFQVPLMVEREDGTVVTLQEQIGGLKLGSVRIRRRTASMARRRPRFLMRRKPASLPIRPVVHRTL